MDLQGDLFNFVHCKYTKVVAIFDPYFISVARCFVLFHAQGHILLLSFDPYASTKLFAFICFILWNVNQLLGNDRETNNKTSAVTRQWPETASEKWRFLRGQYRGRAGQLFSEGQLI
jgi:hypothetical protein